MFKFIKNCNNSLIITLSRKCYTIIIRISYVIRNSNVKLIGTNDAIAITKLNDAIAITKLNDAITITTNDDVTSKTTIEYAILTTIEIGKSMIVILDDAIIYDLKSVS